MKTLYNFTLFGLLVSLSLGVVLAAGNPVLQVRNGHVRGLPPGVANTAVYMTLINHSDEELVLTGATTPAASAASLHNTVRRPGGMTMVPVDNVVIAPRGRVELKTGGLHLMLMGLKSPLRDGNNVRLNLQFQGGFTQSIQLPVISVLNE